jgi:catechol 2,3-dioxygenase-like lactoylglutathione lyase family enzyme
MVTLTQTIPALPARNVSAAVEYYGHRLGFEALHVEGGFAVLGRDEAVLHLWEAGDESWQQRGTGERPVRSGAESFIAGTASCRIRVDGVDELYEELRGRDVLHPAARGGVTDTEHGARELAAVDLDGNLVVFFQWDAAS